MKKPYWLWGIHKPESEIVRILKKPEHKYFFYYAEILFSRVNNVQYVLDLIGELTFVKKWSAIKKRMRKDGRNQSKIYFWQTLYERSLKKFHVQGIKIRESKIKNKVEDERIKYAKYFNAARKSKSMSQMEVAEKMGVVQPYISKIETGRENVSLDSLKKISEILDVRINIERIIETELFKCNGTNYVIHIIENLDTFFVRIYKEKKEACMGSYSVSKNICGEFKEKFGMDAVEYLLKVSKKDIEKHEKNN